MSELQTPQKSSPNPPLRSHMALVIGALGLGLVLHTACQSRFMGTSVSPRPAPEAKPGLSPEEEERGASRPDAEDPQGPTPTPPPPEVCSDSHKAARLYFIVDNSNSHGYLSEGSTLRQGTDPVRTKLSVRNRVEPKTYRQEALYTILKRTIELDSKAKASNPGFLGSELGVSYFPLYRGDGNPSTRYPGELEDLSQYVPVTGQGGTAQGLFPTRISPLPEVGADASGGFDEALWQAFAFTHTPGGSTPYATGLRAAVDDLLPAASNPSDPRENILFFLTDGLPTDETPSQVRQLRERLGARTRVFILSVYDPNEDPSVTNSPLYSNLKKAFLGPTQWATKAGNPDLYPQTEAGFARYWSDLIAIPAAISEELIRVSSAAKLGAEIDRILEATTTCTR